MTAALGRRRLWAVGVFAVLLAGTGGEARSTPRGDGTATARDRVELLRARMAVERASHTATRLRDGRVLLVGGIASGERALSSTDLFSSASRSFAKGPDTVAERGGGHAAVLLPDGRVLVLGGWSSGRVTAETELFEPGRRAFRPAARMSSPRAALTATRLLDGRVLVVGGWDGSAALASAEIYDPSTGVFLPTGSMSVPRAQHTATLLRDGRVLVVGGDDGRSVHASAEHFDPATGVFTPAASLAVARHKHAAVLLPDGRVLVLGGSDMRDWRGRLRSTEIYDPVRDRFSRGAAMRASRFKIDAAVARSRREVVVAGGHARVEVYDPRRNRFSTSARTVGAARQFATATSLGRGRVLIVGGYDFAIRPTARAWIFVPGE